jgi:hypothetical protein
MPKGVRPHGLGDPGPADDPPGAVAVQPAAIGREEDWPLAALADG